MFDSLKITTSYLSFYCFWFFKPFSINEVRFLRTEPHSHLSMLMCKEFSRIVCVSLFSYQGCPSCDSFFTLSHFFFFVKHFFKFFQSFSNSSGFRNCSSDLWLSALFKRLDYFNIFILSCQALFLISFFLSEIILNCLFLRNNYFRQLN